MIDNVSLIHPESNLFNDDDDDDAQWTMKKKRTNQDASALKWAWSASQPVRLPEEGNAKSEIPLLNR